MKNKKIIGALSLTALSALTLVGCGYDQTVQKYDDITDSDYTSIKGQPIWNGNITEILTNKVDVSNGYQIKLRDNGIMGNEVTFADIDGVTGITYTYYSKGTKSDNSKVKLSEIYKPGDNEYWDKDKMHVTSAIGTEQSGDNIKQKGEYFVVVSFEVNTKRYNQIPDLVTEVDIHEPTLITDETFNFPQKSVEFTGEEIRNYASVTLNGETIELNSTTITDEQKKKLGITSISYTYIDANNNSYSGGIAVGSYTVKLELGIDEGFQSPQIESYESSLFIRQKSASVITYNTNGHGTKASVTVDGNTLTSDALAAPSAVDGYQFDGWYIDEELKTEANSSTAVQGSMTLYAKWTQTAFTVTYDENLIGVANQTDLTNVTALPADFPTLTDPSSKYTFGGWYSDPKFTTQAVSGSTITKDTTLYAKWTLTTASTEILDETFDIINPESYATVEKINTSNTDGKLVITPNGTDSGYVEFAVSGVEAATDTEKKYAITFEMAEGQAAKSWASFRVFSGDKYVFDNSNDADDKSQVGIRFAENTTTRATIADFAKTAGTTYTYTIEIKFLTGDNAGKAQVVVSISDGTTKKATETQTISMTSVTKLSFGNAKDATRTVTLDNLKISEVTVD